MRFGFVTAAAVAATIVSASANAAIIHDYEFTTDLSDSVPGGVALQPSLRDNTTGSVNNGLYTFDAGAGLQLSSQLPGDTYTIDIEATFDTTSGYRKLISFNDLSSDRGLYFLDGRLVLFNVTGQGQDVIDAGTQFDVSLSRDGATGMITGFLNGVEQFTYDDTDNNFLASTDLWFLRDDTAQNREDSAGTANFITISGNAVTADVPEPASWAMFIGGFGLVGGAIRRRKAVVSFA